MLSIHLVDADVVFWVDNYHGEFAAEVAISDCARSVRLCLLKVGQQALDAWPLLFMSGLSVTAKHVELLATAANRIDELEVDPEAIEQVSEWLDWLAFLTREHFGMQLRVLHGCSHQREYVLERATVQAQFRRRLADLCVDALRHDGSVPGRFRAVCHDLLDDMQTQYATILAFMRSGIDLPPLRRGSRKDYVVANPWRRHSGTE